MAWQSSMMMLRLVVFRTGSALLGWCSAWVVLCSGCALLGGAALGWCFARRFLLLFTTLLLPFRFPFASLLLPFRYSFATLALLFSLNCSRHQGVSPRCQGSSPPFKRLRRVINRPEVFYIYPIFINLFCQKFGS